LTGLGKSTRFGQVQRFWLKSSWFWPKSSTLGQVQHLPAKSSDFHLSPALFSQVQHFSAKSSTFAPSPALLDQAKVTSHAHVTSRKPGLPSLEFPIIQEGYFSTSCSITFDDERSDVCFREKSINFVAAYPPEPNKYTFEPRSRQ
jgi:hypothetical protein